MWLKRVLAVTGVHYVATRFGWRSLKGAAFDEKYRRGDWSGQSDAASELTAVVAQHLRSGDLLIVLKRHVAPISKPSTGYVAGHGSPWDYDRRVPILFWRPGLQPAKPTAAADTVDILATVARWVDLPLPAGSVDGECRSEAARCR